MPTSVRCRRRANRHGIRGAGAARRIRARVGVTAHGRHRQRGAAAVLACADQRRARGRTRLAAAGLSLGETVAEATSYAKSLAAGSAPESLRTMKRQLFIDSELSFGDAYQLSVRGHE